MFGEVIIPCDDVILAIGQENAFPWIERDLGIEFDKWDLPEGRQGRPFNPRCRGCSSAAMPPWDRRTSSGPWSTAHQAAISIHKLCQGEPVTERPPRGMTLSSRKMGMHEWAYKNDYNAARAAPGAACRAR